ncbi:MAG TPA: hypothetical protein VKD46_00975 [bacterium]|nr:hypothetical protein [bacterium]
MIVTFPSGTRSVPADRNGLRIVQGGGSVHGGGTTITYVDYTVPANRRADIYMARGFYLVTTVLAAAQNESIHLDFISPAITNAVFAISLVAAAVGDRQQWEAERLFLTAGDRIQILGTLAAGAGVVTDGGSISGVEYDA